MNCKSNATPVVAMFFVFAGSPFSARRVGRDPAMMQWENALASTL